MNQTTFLTHESFFIKHVTEKTTGIIDSCPGCGRPHTAQPIAKTSEVKDLALVSPV